MKAIPRKPLGRYEIGWLRLLGEVLTISATRILAEYEEFQTWHYERQLVNGFSEQDIQDYPTTELLDEMLVCINYTSQEDNQISYLEFVILVV